jgi:hypothetical protein
MRLLTIICLLLITKGVSASTFLHFEAALPPDTTVSVVDRAAAVLLIDEGKKMLNAGRTRDALATFRQAYVKDQNSARAAYWIGKSHYQLSNYGYALQYAKIAESLSQAEDGDVFFLLAEAYHRQGSLDSARMNYDLALIQMRQSKSRAFNIQQKIDEVAFAISVQNAEVKFAKQILPGEVVSGYNDYAPVLTDNGQVMYFVSRRPDTKGGGINPDDQSYFEDIYRARWNETDKIWDSITNDLGRLNSDGFDAVSHITQDGNTVYVTLNTSVLPIKKKSRTRSSDICVSEKSVKGTWGTPKPIKNKTINTSFFDGAATLTADGNTMYFVTDRRGEKSMSDIYVVERVGKNWGVAKPLPANINSTGNETTPFITADGRFLFFSSDGLTGMGGYDIYVSENLGNGVWSNPINLGHEFNTVNNDTHFRYYPELKKGYFSSYRVQGQKASIDIFEIDLEGWSIPVAR